MRTRKSLKPLCATHSHSRIEVDQAPGRTDYDILVRHAFGRADDLLAEVAYSPLMGQYLTFRGSKAYANSQEYPDENFAREVMQLFSIGLFKLSSDGTRLEEGGVLQATYDNADILDGARAWTGFGEPPSPLSSRHCPRSYSPILPWFTSRAY